MVSLVKRVIQRSFVPPLAFAKPLEKLLFFCNMSLRSTLGAFFRVQCTSLCVFFFVIVALCLKEPRIHTCRVLVVRSALSFRLLRRSGTTSRGIVLVFILRSFPGNEILTILAEKVSAQSQLNPTVTLC